MSGRGREAYIAGAVIPVFCLAAGLFEAIGTWNTGSSDCNATYHVTMPDYTSHMHPPKTVVLYLYGQAQKVFQKTGIGAPESIPW